MTSFFLMGRTLLLALFLFFPIASGAKAQQDDSIVMKAPPASAAPSMPPSGYVSTRVPETAPAPTSDPKSKPTSVIAKTMAPAPIVSTSATTAEGPPPVVLELFTSQGCAFCPPADELMGQMIQQQSVIGLSCHVDYFGVRKNNLGKSFCTRRQGDYNRLIGTGPRYTPQLIVNGHMDMIGYEGGKVSAAILKARSEKIAPIALVSTGADEYNFSLPAVNTGNNPVSLWMAVFDAPQSIAMTEGNNFGKKVTYYNVVSRIDDLGSWDGKAMARAVNAKFAPANGGIAVIAQDTRTGHILAAGSITKTLN